MPDQFHVPIYLEWVATFAWALSGALVGVKREFDEVGVFVIAVVSSFGGGIIRDGLFLQRPPVVTTNQTYLIIITVAVLVVLVLGRFIIRLPYLEQIISLIDAIGTPAFCIVGVQLALSYGYPITGVLLLGVISGTGGGILRDVMTARVPAVLQPGQFSTLYVLLACLLFIGLEYYYCCRRMKPAGSPSRCFLSPARSPSASTGAPCRSPNRRCGDNWAGDNAAIDGHTFRLPQGEHNEETCFDRNHGRVRCDAADCSLPPRAGDTHSHTAPANATASDRARANQR